MDLDSGIFKTFASINWFSNLGKRPAQNFPFTTEFLDNYSQVQSEIISDAWQDARTESQGDLTGFLAKNRNDIFGGQWNRLAKESRQKINSEIQPLVFQSLLTQNMSELTESVLLDLNRISLFSAYSKKVKNLPQFYANLLEVYKAGMIPCGWKASIEEWPQGKLLIF